MKMKNFKEFLKGYSKTYDLYIHQNTDTKIIASRTIYSGHLPPASELQKYAEISPDIPNRIINMVTALALMLIILMCDGSLYLHNH